jgi:hypothetical protein
VTTGTDSGVYGGYAGIDAFVGFNGEYGLGAYLVNGQDVTITTGYSSVVAGGVFGIRANSYLNAGGDLTITTGDASTVVGGSVGIAANNQGLKYYSGGYYPPNPGILAGDLTITTGADSFVQGGYAGIAASNYYGGDVEINVGGDGADAYGYGAAVIGGVFGVAVLNDLGGDTTITTGDGSFVLGVYGAGIASYNTLSGDNNIETGSYSGVYGGVYGIAAANFASYDINVSTGFYSGVGGGYYGIATAAIFSGDTNVTTGALSLVGGGVHGISAYAYGSGDINITTGYYSGTVGYAGSGINVDSYYSGSVNITNYGAVLGNVAAVSVFTNGAPINITNNGLMANLSFNEADLVIDAFNGPVTIVNNGDLIGRVLTSDVDDVMVNNGYWTTEGFNNFYTGFDVLYNSYTGFIQAADGYGTAEVTTFNSLELMYNAGVVSMVDQYEGDGSNISDTLVVTGDYVGLGGLLAVDAFLGEPGSVGDVLAVGGSTYGVTEIVVNDTNSGPGAYNTEGILVVDVAGNSDASHFELLNGPIDKGMFFYDLIFDDTGPTDQHLLVSLPDREVFETLAATAGANNVWYDSADAWSDRQNALRDQLIYGCNIVQAVADPPIAEDVCQNNLWVSIRGSWTQRDWEEGYSFANKSYDFKLDYDQDTYGVVGGADFGVDLGGGGKLLFGGLAGYMTSDLSFDEGGNSIDLEGGTFGLYATLLQGGFFLDVLGKADFMNADYDAGSLGDYGDNDSGSVDSYGVRADMGYHFQTGGMFLEPVVSFAAVSTEMDDLDLGGTTASNGETDSVRGGAGARVGFDGEMITGSLIGRAWYNFTQEDSITIESLGPDLDVSDDELEGLFGEVAGQLDFRIAPNATLFVNGGFEFNDDFTKSSVTGGFNWSW